ncbi:hypothetical protein ASPZODRAFT_69121 [Penicilliopsis zonata CBS 506.65]|uniref:Uncharacterized protein n=1 Tax=Penicilliopsis zonata CBS 506.65 TaxID=1073090 RepID=A0A1L9SEP8_9EURO|nr:hypothetical protein ASPZODRAFT_69121 [Penicilliopsis zonata CBS 506.65]OJJ45690.1 hypothetical protein ASPZODRAFT_69121 [Penicilliopsis zonata CBS 506.65]
MAASVSYSASNLLLKPLPDLDVAARHTTSHALYQIHFVGILQPWANFEAEVANTYNGQTWNLQAIASKLTGNFLAGSVHEERVFVCDERGIQGRLEGRAGTALGAVFKAQNQDLKLGAFKGALPPHPGYRKAPDFVLMTQAHMAKVVGEAKSPWISEHHLEDLYMFDLRLKHGFLTTYNQTVFLRKVDVGRAWGLEYSPVIYHGDRGSVSGTTVSFCQSLYHVGLLALADSDFGTSIGLRNQTWTISE